MENKKDKKAHQEGNKIRIGGHPRGSLAVALSVFLYIEPYSFCPVSPHYHVVPVEGRI